MTLHFEVSLKKKKKEGDFLSKDSSSGQDGAHIMIHKAAIVLIMHKGHEKNRF